MKTNNGFTLIEVLIAMIVLSVGLLGLAGLQMSSLRNNLSSYHRSQATQLAYDMADRMRVNSVNALLGATSTYITTTPSNAGQQNSCSTTTGTCTPVQMAEEDLFSWNTQLIDVLPDGVGLIETLGAVGNNAFTITITWNDKNKIKAEYKTEDQLTFTMSFKL
jgi:type IV pilus assembly protein PilV